MVRIGSPEDTNPRVAPEGAGHEATVHDTETETGGGHHAHPHGDHDHRDHGPALPRSLPGVGANGAPAPLPGEIAPELLRARLSGPNRPPQAQAGAMLGMGHGGLADPKVTRAKLEASPGFQRLDATERARFAAAFEGSDPKALALRGGTSFVVESPAFAGATPDRQARALRAVAKNAENTTPGAGFMGTTPGGKPPPAPSIEDTLRALRGTEGWAALSPEQRSRVEARVKQPGPAGETARRTFHGRTNDATFLLGDGKAQAEDLDRTRGMIGAFVMRSPEEIGRKLEASPGFAALGAPDKKALRELSTSPAGYFRHQRLGELMDTPEWGRAGAKEQTAALRKLATAPDNPAVPTSDVLRRRVEGSPGWRHLTSGEQAELQERITTRGPDGEQQRRSLALALDNPRALLRTSDEQAQGLRDYLSATPGGQDPTTTLPRDASQRLTGLPGYQALDAESKGRLDALIGGPTNGLSYRARTRLDALARDVQVDSRVVQSKELKRFLSEGQHLPANVSDLADSGSGAPGRLSAARDLGEQTFQGTRAPATSQTITVHGREIALVYPNELKTIDATGKLPTPQEVAAALGRMPASQVGSIRSVTLSPIENPSNGFWGKEYKIGNFQSAATAGPDGKVTIYPSAWTTDALASTLRHELGHVLDPTLGAVPGGQVQARADWSRAQAADLSFSSTYAKASVAEDVAETFALYTATRGTPAHDELRAIFPNRFRILDARSTP